MIRLSFLALYIIAAALYARKDWFVSLCALILLMAVVEHPDMPKGMLGIPGLNPWNLLFLIVVFAWIKARRQEGLTWDMPPSISFLLVLYLGVVLVGWVRMFLDPGELHSTTGSLISEQLFNTIKWVIPGLMLFDAARTRTRFLMAVLCVLGVYLLFAIQVIKWMPLSAAVNGGNLSERSLKILVNEIGFHRVNLSAMLAGASWAIFAARPLAADFRQRMFVLGAFVIAVFAQALTAGRAGYVTWAAVGFTLCALRWRKYLLLAPVLVIGVLTLAPGVAERMLEGFSRQLAAGGGLTVGATGPDVYTITAGRNLAWPMVIEKIKERPFVGWGREGMVRTGMTAKLAMFKEGFSHPHNAYLEWLLDNGLIGFVLVMPLYLLLIWKSLALFLDSRSPIFVATGGITTAFLLALMVAAVGSQTFYPREGWMGMWCAIGLMLRVHVERTRWSAAPARAGTKPRAGWPRARPAVAAVARAAPRPHWAATTLRPAVSPLKVDLLDSPPAAGTSAGVKAIGNVARPARTGGAASSWSRPAGRTPMHRRPPNARIAR